MLRWTLHVALLVLAASALVCAQNGNFPAVSGSAAANQLAGWTSATRLGAVAPNSNPAWTFGLAGLDDIECWASANCEIQLSTGAMGTGDNSDMTPGVTDVISGTTNASIDIRANSPTLGALITLGGTTSGSAAIGVPANAGTPCTILLPSSSPAAGQFHVSAAPSGSPPTCATSWVTAFASCGTVAANGACGNSTTTLGHCIGGIATLNAGTSTITGLSPAFTGSGSFFVTTNDITTITNASKGVPASASTITFTGTGTDNISFVACGT